MLVEMISLNSIIQYKVFVHNRGVRKYVNVKYVIWINYCLINNEIMCNNHMKYYCLS